MVHISGPRAEMRVGYQRAAVLGAWTITPSGERRNTFVFSAALTYTHPTWFGMTPLTLVVRIGSTEWTWENVTPIREGGAVDVLLTERPIVKVGVV
jgi:hypothetical protein